MLASLHRFHALAIGPGCGRDDATALQVRATVGAAPVPVVIDGDGLFAMAWGGDDALGVLRRRSLPTVITPHDGEFELLTGTVPGSDRLAAARRLAAAASCTVLLKGPCTVVAAPDGEALLVAVETDRVARANIGLFMAQLRAMAGDASGAAALADEARRFIVLIDTLYDQGVKLIASADAQPDQLYRRGENAKMFERTASRLDEMQSEAWLERPLRE